MGKGTRAAGQRNRAASSEPSSSGANTPPPPSRRAEPQDSGKPKRSGRGATFSVLMMTLVSLAAVGVLAAQAKATAPSVRAAPTSTAAKSSSKSGSGGTTTTTTYALPANSGSGTRIVYSPSEKRVWLVEGSTVERTMEVVPGTIAAASGNYEVSAKTPGATGSDGVQVLYVVRFAAGSSTTYGFDSDENVTGLPPAPTGETAGIRMAQTDAQALYQFSSVGTTVVVTSS